MTYPQVWITDEMPARAIVVKGRSAIDWDCLVGYYEDEVGNPLWIIEHSGHVCDKTRKLDASVRARPVKSYETPPPSLLPAGRHNARIPT